MDRDLFYAGITGMILGVILAISFTPHFLPKSPSEHSVFIYGTLQNNLIRYYACHCLVKETSVKLPGYKKVGLNIVPATSHVVQGSVIHITAKQLNKIDDYEDVPTNYTRQEIIINGEKHWVYLKN